ncbi:MAG: FdtA/QdtA family cupin domain-containing protein [Flavobacteriaceae bacterium]|jgi:hypothetical protein|nr:FdtA/QdtA family cupin domain-containing protein [Flavobacteriaceae bacterium]MDG2314900.1 FdtA/QdtA family cupin domain-containing protein [Flavobacteriaceae bacterium]
MKYKIIDFPTIKDARGNLAVLEKNTLPFDFKRVYYLYDVPSNSYRGGHAHISQREVLVAISGSFEVILKHDNQETSVFLNAPDKGLLIDTMVWRELKNFSSGSICLVLASDEFDEADYIRDWETFVKNQG